MLLPLATSTSSRQGRPYNHASDTPAQLAGHWIPVRPVSTRSPAGTTASGLALSIDGPVDVTEDTNTIALDYGFLKIVAAPDSLLHPPPGIVPAQLRPDALRARLTIASVVKSAAETAFWGWAVLTAAPGAESTLVARVNVPGPRPALLRIVCYREGDQLVVERAVEQDRAIIFAPVRYRKAN
jgi:hypothetical protein